jgi:hypothetical protein
VYEHWDENVPPFDLESKDRNKGTRALHKVRPDAKPWSITYGRDGPVIGGVLALKDIATQLDVLERMLLGLEKQTRYAKEQAG